jgi:hypothetical protein
MSRRKQLSTTHRLVWGLTSPIQAGSTPLHRLKSSKTDCPGAMSAKAFAKSHQPAGCASGPCRNFRPHNAPKFTPTSGRSGQAAGLTPAHHPAGDGPRLTRPPEVGTSQPRAPARASSHSALFQAPTSEPLHRISLRPTVKQSDNQPYHRVLAVRLEVPDAASRNRPDASQHVPTALPLKQLEHGAKDRRASPPKRQTHTPRTRACQAPPAHSPCHAVRSAGGANEWRGLIDHFPVAGVPRKDFDFQTQKRKINSNREHRDRHFYQPRWRP